MSLGETLLKVAIGVAIAKGVSTLGKGSAGAGTVEAGSGKPYGGGMAAEREAKRLPGGLENVMKDALAGAPKNRGSATGGTHRNSGASYQDNSTTGTSRSTDAGAGGLGGGLGDLLEQMINGGATSAGRNSGTGAGQDGGSFAPSPRPSRQNAPKGGLEELLAGSGGAGLGGLLGAILGGAGPTTLPEPKARQQELAAALALRAMIQAVKCDGELDETEKRKLMDQMGEASREEVAFVNAELQRPVDVDGLARQVPNGMEEQVYIVSLMGIDLDNQREASYLAALAKALELSPQEVNGLHDRMGAPRMFR
jgi:hypothetical protein